MSEVIGGHKCDICGGYVHELGKTYVDGATIMGPWADMCEGCYRKVGIGLGTGRGQRYDAKTGVKVEG